MSDRVTPPALRRVNGHDLFVDPNMLLAIDVDETLIKSTHRDSQEWQRSLLTSLFIKLAGGVVGITGRGFDAVDETFDLPVVSVEHDAAQRVPVFEDGKYVYKVVDNVVKPDTTKIAADLREALKDKFNLYAIGDHFEGPGVVIEVKDYSNALIHHNTIPHDDILLLERVAKQVHAKHGLHDTHVVKIGSDAVEISVKGRDKATALRTIMKHPMFEGRTIVAIGDSNPDALMMEIALETGGNGIAVGNSIKDTADKKYTRYITHKAESIDAVWDYLKWLHDHPALNGNVNQDWKPAMNKGELIHLGEIINRAPALRP